MASTFSPLLKIELIGIGDQNNTWGTTTNTNLGTLIEDAIAGSAAVDVTSANVTLTTSDGSADQARCAALRITGTPGVSRNIIAPARSKIYVIANGSNAAVVLKTSTSTGLTIPTGEIYLAYFDTVLLDFKLVGRASSSINTANTLVLRDGTGSFGANIIAANTFSGDLNGTINTLTTAVTQTAGNNSTKVATTAFVTTALQSVYPVGSIYTATVATNPATLFGFGTWVAFGAGRVLLGNGGGFSAGATGGSADAIVVSHSHSASSSASVTDPGHAHSLQNLGSAQAGPDNGGAPVSVATGWTTGRNPGPTNAATTGISVGVSTTVNSTGSSGTNANLQPYIVVYMWNRTA
jgi:hypothetical protein